MRIQVIHWSHPHTFGQRKHTEINASEVKVLCKFALTHFHIGQQFVKPLPEKQNNEQANKQKTTKQALFELQRCLTLDARNKKL